MFGFMMNEQLDSTDHTESHDAEEKIPESPVQEGGDACCAEPHHHENASMPQEQEAHTEPEPTPARKVYKRLGVVVIFCALLSGYVYTHSASEENVQRITSAFPFPAFLVGRSVVTYAQFYQEKEALTKYFASTEAEGTGQPDGEQLNSMVLQALTNKAVVKKFASDFGVQLNQAKVGEFYQNFVDANAGSDASVMESQLQETFGWSASEFKHRIVEPIVLSSQVAEYIDAEDFFQEPVKQAMENAHARVKNNGEDFALVADEVHEREGVKIKSDLGFIKKSALPEVWGETISQLALDEVSEVITLPQGYAIFKVTERIKNEDEDEQLHIFAITIPKVTLDQLVSKYLDRVTVRTFLRY